MDSRYHALDSRSFRITEIITYPPQEHKLLLLLAVNVPCLLYAGETGVSASFLFPASGIACITAVLAALIVRWYCFQVRIEEDGFYIQTTPFNRKYYRYDSIRNCGTVEKVYRYRRSGGRFGRTHYFYFIFTDIHGEQRNFQFQSDIFGHETAVLQNRIEAAGGTVRR